MQQVAVAMSLSLMFVYYSQIYISKFYIRISRSLSDITSIQPPFLVDFSVTLFIQFAFHEQIRNLQLSFQEFLFFVDFNATSQPTQNVLANFCVTGQD